MKKKHLMLLISIISLIVMAACGKSEAVSNEGGSGGKNKYKITINNGLQEDSSMHEGLMRFKEVAEEKSNGQLQIEVFSGATLYASDREAIEAVQNGNIEMTVPPTAALAGFSKDFMVLDSLFLFDEVENARAALDGELGEQLLDTLPPLGLRGLSWGEAGMRQITNNKGPIEKVEDLKGLKFRVQENPLHIDSFNELGANASPFAYGEVYSALQQNVFNAMETPLNLIDKDHFYEVQDYLTISNHVYTGEVLLINDNFFTGLPEELQKALTEAAETFTEYQRPLAFEEVKDSYDVVSDHMEINELSSDQKKEFVEQLAPVYEKYKAEFGDLLELAQSYN
ncbi:TRAP transporter substrate-binding protein [Siminovitchia acidinfaciens]|uniref:TRAP transporter substrate-binding protein n=1 Tax=Siminovitchia acidinfaciens TaxID=2321395 RepID=A0A429XSZ3_9BACI|nr:TRAP transporter substrate-binding protein [Siminovitchia acidinfaciens]RST70307.1 TRAP transporter substrate-binding protein [Siminovitchia acidinfaciens]